MQVKQTILNVITFALILLFVYTATSKLLSHQNFIAVLKQSPLLHNFASFISWSIPIIELIIATLLIIPSLRKQGLLASAILMSLFTAYIAYMLLSKSHLPCSCGGVLKQLSWQQHLFFNIIFTIAALIGFKIEKSTQLFIAINRSRRIPV